MKNTLALILIIPQNFGKLNYHKIEYESNKQIIRNEEED